MKCDYCTEKCPQAETICELAKGRMYVTNEVVKLQKQLEEYKTLEEQGFLLRLPCKVGDTVYVKMASYCDIQYAEAEVRDFTHFTSCGFCVVVTSKHFDKQNIPFSEFGKTVFLTQSEAEQKLKEMESD